MKKFFTLILLALLGMTNAWADDNGFFDTGLAYVAYTLNGTESGSDLNKWDQATVSLGTVTSSLTFTKYYAHIWKTSSGDVTSVKMSYKNSASSDWTDVTGTWLSNDETTPTNQTWGNEAISGIEYKSTDASGNYTFSIYFTGTGTNPATFWASNNNSGNYNFTYTILPPKAVGLSVTPSGDKQAGSGTEADPYIVTYNGSLTLTAAASQEHTDANSSLLVKFGDADYSATAANTISEITSSTVQSIVIKTKYNNSTDNLDGEEATTTIYYKAEPAYEITTQSEDPNKGTLSNSWVNAYQYYQAENTVTATAKPGYTFKEWKADVNTITINDPTSASTTFRATTKGTVTAYFTKNPTFDLTVKAGEHIESVTGGKNGEAAVPFDGGTITATPATGYDFDGWTADPVANASFGDVTAASTTVTVNNGSVEVTAKAKEHIYNVTVNTNISAGATLKFGDESKDWGSVASVGIDTKQAVTVTLADGYKFDGDPTTADGAKISGSNGSYTIWAEGADGTITINLAEDLNSAWYVEGTTSGSVFPEGWNANANTRMMHSAPGSKSISWSMTVDEADLAAVSGFKVLQKKSAGDAWWGYGKTGSEWDVKFNANSNAMHCSDAADMKLNLTVAGTYTFTIADTTAEYPVLTITYPEHVHAWATEWSHDETGHWHACTVAGCPITDYSTCGLEAAAYGVHTYGDNKLETSYYTCSVCGYEDADRKAAYIAPVDLYVIGSMNSWASKDASYKMTETLTDGDLPQWTFDFGTADLANQNFKINNGDWDKGYNIGVSKTTPATKLIEGVINLRNINDGTNDNIYLGDQYSSATNVVITLNKDASDNWTLTATGTFTEGEKPIPDLYLRGSMNSFVTSDDWKFARNGSVWTLTKDVTVSDWNVENGGFKVGDTNFGDYNLGLNDAGDQLTEGEEYVLKNGSNGNLWLNLGTEDGNYTFTLTKDGDAWKLAVACNHTTLHVGPAGYATYYTSFHGYTMPTSLEGYIFDGQTIQKRYDAGAQVPAGEGLVIKGTEADYTLAGFASTPSKSADNYLYGTNEKTQLEENADVYYYGLSLNAKSELESVGFYWMEEQGAAFENGAHKAYLMLAKSLFNAGNAPMRFLFLQPSAPTGLDAISAQGENQKFFLNGALYIRHNGHVYNAAGQLVK